MSDQFDANRRFCDYVLWIDQGSMWINQIAEAAESKRGTGQVVLVVDKADLDNFRHGMRRISRALLGIAPSCPPPVTARPPRQKPQLRLIAGGAQVAA
jgi:hypothetical protein